MTISIVNQKGGTGKTTSTINIGRALALNGYRILLIDLDPQGSLSYSLGVINPEYTISDVIIDNVELKDVIHHIDHEYLDIIPASISLADLEINLIDNKNRAMMLKEIIDKQVNYDFILIDCPPSLSLLTINALSASKFVIIPFQLEVLSIRGLNQIIDSVAKIQSIYNSDLQILGLLPVMVDVRKKLTHEVFNYVTETFNARIFDNYIRTNVRLSEAPSFAKSVFSYAAESNGAADYSAVANEIVKEVEQHLVKN